MLLLLLRLLDVASTLILCVLVTAFNVVVLVVVVVVVVFAVVFVVGVVAIIFRCFAFERLYTTSLPEIHFTLTHHVQIHSVIAIPRGRNIKLKTRRT